MDGNVLSEHHAPETLNGHGTGRGGTQSSSGFEIMCGPLLNYQRMSEENSDVFWHGSVLIVAKPGPNTPTLELRSMGTWSGSGKGKMSPAQTVEGLKLYSDPNKTFWRFTLRVPLGQVESRWQYSIPNTRFLAKVSSDASRDFVVPSSTESMRIMFHSCNGFSVGTDEEFWSGGYHRMDPTGRTRLTDDHRTCLME